MQFKLFGRNLNLGRTKGDVLKSLVDKSVSFSTSFYLNKW